jgi:predicted nucleotidyltransferase
MWIERLASNQPVGKLTACAAEIGHDRQQSMAALSATVESQIVEQVLATSRPDRIVLFGSRGRGSARFGSDYDLLIIEPSSQPRHLRSGRYFRSLSTLPVEVDVMVYTPEEVAEWNAVPQAFVTTAIREGVTLYERKG